MQSISLRGIRYDTATIAFYWATAILVVEQWVGAQIIECSARCIAD